MIGLGKSCYCQTWLERRFSWNENLHWKQNWAAKSTSLKENAGKVKSVFVIRTAQWVKSLDIALNITGVEKYAQKTCSCSQSGGHSIRVLNERRVGDGGNLCPLWLVILKSVLNSVRDTFQLQYSWPWAVVSYTLLAAVPWNRLGHSHQRARLCVYFNWF